MSYSDEIEVLCPTCQKDVVVCIEIEGPAPEIGIYGYGFGGFVVEQECECEITDEYISDLAESEFNDMQEANGESRLDSGYDDDYDY
jgi:hypothetical protein